MPIHGKTPNQFIVSAFQEHNLWIDPTGSQSPSSQKSPGRKVISAGMALGYNGSESRLQGSATASGGTSFLTHWRVSDHSHTQGDGSIFEATIELSGLSGARGTFDENDVVFGDIYKVDNDLLATPEGHDYGRVKGEHFPREGMGPSIYIGPAVNEIVFRVYVYGDAAVAAHYVVREY